MANAAVARTYLAFHHNAKLHTLQTVVTAVRPFSALEEANKAMFKQGGDDDHVVVTEQTIFHPQGGGQPSDVGTIKGIVGGGGSGSGGEAGTEGEQAVFDVASARMDAVHDGQVLHLGRFGGAARLRAGQAAEQAIDADRRLLYSRLHTAGHVLGAAVRHLLEAEVAGFDELKASHFPESAGCEFQGVIEGRWKGAIQARVDEYVARAMPVEIEWWDAADFRANGAERLIPADAGMASPDGRFRVVRIVGAEVYPCGGTHVDTTDLCGKTTVRKITRSKGTSRVAYAVD